MKKPTILLGLLLLIFSCNDVAIEKVTQEENTEEASPLCQLDSSVYGVSYNDVRDSLGIYPLIKEGKEYDQGFHKGVPYIILWTTTEEPTDKPYHRSKVIMCDSDYYYEEDKFIGTRKYLVYDEDDRNRILDTSVERLNVKYDYLTDSFEIWHQFWSESALNEEDRNKDIYVNNKAEADSLLRLWGLLLDK